ncbi:flavodoxin [Suipraeoptans intestinalis]|uniref:Flavodoxin n=1 Tax=Suipraeoptans intestinalis TaxID=2606628 RepID=A0A6N7V277_9FIRM|nr:flavodoxin [Suipraeoptans intestinalis]MDD7769692.1 flavodoxin [Suipraeoptans intestinalis]MSR94679.1 flavodoxin [Suipraeoptans intestinalis]
MSIPVVYWSGTGNTEKMAEAIAAGIREGGAEATVLGIDAISPEELAGNAVFALGCPAMGEEVLEEGEMEPFVEALEGKVSGKKILLFGSYDWGDGEWMRSWEERMKNAGAVLSGDAGVIANMEPDQEAIDLCKSAGKALAGNA